MEKRICLITGGNSGIGKAAAIQMAQKGIKTMIGSRDEAKGFLAVEEIKEKSQNHDVELLLLDMSSQRSINHAVKNFKANYHKLDILIHNAADFDISRKAAVLSENNTETVWATNHIGPVLLTELLLNELKQIEQGRIITVVSQGLMLHPFLEINLKDPEFKANGFSVVKAYYQSKLAQVMYTYWLSKQLRNTRITVNAIRVTNVKVDIQRYPNLSKLMRFMYSLKSKFSISPEEMARTYTYLATSPEVDSVTGKYFDQKNRVVSSSKYSKNLDNINALMDVTMKYIR